jgi:hypothetical protein
VVPLWLADDGSHFLLLVLFCTICLPINCHNLFQHSLTLSVSQLLNHHVPLSRTHDGTGSSIARRDRWTLQRGPPRERDSALDDVWGRQRVVAAAEVAEVGEAEAAVAAAAQLEEEDPEQQNNRILQTMQRHVTQHRMKPAFYKALFLNPLYAYSMSLLKLFYNPEDPKKAAQQYCQHWEFKLKFFGLEQLPKPLTAKQSLQSQDKACLYSGCMQLFRDDHGRIVLCLLPSLLSKQQANGNSKQDDCKHLVRSLFYVWYGSSCRHFKTVLRRDCHPMIP